MIIEDRLYCIDQQLRIYEEMLIDRKNETQIIGRIRDEIRHCYETIIDSRKKSFETP